MIAPPGSPPTQHRDRQQPFDEHLQIGLSAPDDLGRFDPDAQRAALAAIADAGIDHVFTADHVGLVDGSGIDGPVRLAALGVLSPAWVSTWA